MIKYDKLRTDLVLGKFYIVSREKVEIENLGSTVNHYILTKNPPTAYCYPKRSLKMEYDKLFLYVGARRISNEFFYIFLYKAEYRYILRADCMEQI